MRSFVVAVLIAGCHGVSPHASPDAATVANDAATPSLDGFTVGGVFAPPSCQVFGAPGSCIATSACAALGDHTPYAGHCPGAANIQCCIVTPNVADNPPPPAGWKLMAQASVTSEMTSWAVMILNDPVDYPMFSTTIRTFATSGGGTLMVLARVEWHPPDFQNGVVHRGVTLYQPA